MKGIIKLGRFRIPLDRFVSVEVEENGRLRIYYLRCNSQVHSLILPGWDIWEVDRALAEAQSEDAENLLKMHRALALAEDRLSHIQRLVGMVRKYRNWNTAAYTMKEYYGLIDRSAEGGIRNIRKLIDTDIKKKEVIIPE